jgi:hypothetical protein
MRSGAPFLCGLVALGAAGCLLYTDPINVPPEVSIEGPGYVHRGEKAGYSARVVDTTEGGFSFAWGKGPTCPDALATAAEMQGQQPLPSATRGFAEIVHRERESYCVWVIVTDRLGARGWAVRPVSVLAWSVALKGPATIHRGEPMAFTAELIGDADSPRSPSLSWHKTPGLCPGEPALAGDTLEACRGSRRCEVIHTGSGGFCVTVMVRDLFGMEELAQIGFSAESIANRPPRAILQITEVTPGPKTPPFELMTRVRASASQSMDPDGDVLAYTFRLLLPDGRPVSPPLCPDGQSPKAEVCFTLEATGDYRLELTVDDGTKRDLAMLSFAVEDRPPCIRQTLPDYTTAPKLFAFHDKETVFRVDFVDDDGDPYPPRQTPMAQSAFVWLVRLGTEREFQGAFDRVVGNLPMLTLRAFAFRPGDRVQVRVEYRDRVNVIDPNARDFSVCDPDVLMCALRATAPTCYQWITWTVEYL